MRRRYQVLFTLRWVHDFFPGGRSLDFALRPTAACRQRLRNQGMVFKPLETGALIAIETRETTPNNFVPIRAIESTVDFSFLLELRNAALASHTRPFHLAAPEALGRTRLLYLANLDLLNNLDPQDEISTAPTVSSSDYATIIPTQFAFKADPVAINQVVVTEIKPGGTSQNIAVTVADPEVELELPTGTYWLKQNGPGGLPAERLVVDDDLLGAQALALVQIFKNQTVDYANPRHYIIHFTTP